MLGKKLNFLSGFELSFKVERGIITLENSPQRAKQGFDYFDGLSQSPALLVLSLMLLEARKSLRVVRGWSGATCPQEEDVLLTARELSTQHCYP